MSLSAAETYLLELINRARLDPGAEAARYKLGLNAGLRPGTIKDTPKEVLAPNSDLSAAAARHSDWLLAKNTFSHTGAGGSSATDRIKASGYELTGTWRTAENLAWSGTTGTINLEKAIAQHHAGLYRSEGHRENIFAEKAREIGLGQEVGKFTQNGTSFNASMLTEKFGLSGSAKFVTGVAYHDRDKDDFYSVGEGLSGYWIREGKAAAKTTATGSYALDAGSGSSATVNVGLGSKTLAIVTLDMSDGNAKLDVMKTASGALQLGFSVSAKMATGITQAELLGAGDLDLTGSKLNNTLLGNKGDNALSGADGNDKLFGYGGEDVLRGGEHADSAYGGTGRDKVYGDNGGDIVAGGAGNDFVFGQQGNDKVFGQDGNDVMYGGQNGDKLFGGDGSDKMFGGTQGDTIVGGQGHDKMYGDHGHDRMFGQDGFDVMYGGANDDRLFGGNGNDRLFGGTGNDAMRGGDGADSFIFTSGDDVVVDFTDNVDTLILHRDALGLKNLNVTATLRRAEVDNGQVVITFDADTKITLNGINKVSALSNDLDFI